MPATKAEANRYSVQVKQWAKWRENQRHVFNEVYGSMAANQDLFLHRKQEPMSRTHWLVTCWNAAWIAADAAAREAPELVITLTRAGHKVSEQKVKRLKAA